MSDQKLVDRILKLYALAAGTSFEHEAGTARAMAEALIAKHNISLPSVKDRTAIATVDYWPIFRGTKWEFILVEAAAELCGCDTFFRTDDEEKLVGSFTICGTIADLEACQYLLAILNEQRMRDWMTAKARGVADRFHSFCYAYARAVEAKVDARLTSLEHQRVRQAYLWFKENVGFNGKSTDLGLHGPGRSNAGRAAGEAASLHRGNLGSPARRIGYR